MLNHKQVCRMVADSYDDATGSVGDVEYHITCRHDGTYIIVRGTEGSAFLSGDGWKDVVRDVRIAPWYDSRTGWAHAGFLKGAQGLMDGGITKHIRCDYPIILAGHSMGGSVSMLLAMMLQKAGYPVAEWVGFGTPRMFIGSRKLPFRATSYRNGGDVVPMVPRWWMGGYRPVPLTEIGPQGRMPNLNDHSIIRYQNALAVRSGT